MHSFGDRAGKYHGWGVEFLKAAHRKLSLNIWKHSLKDVKEFPWAYENRV